MRSGAGIEIVALLSLLGGFCWSFFHAGRLSERQAAERRRRAARRAGLRPSDGARR